MGPIYKPYAGCTINHVKCQTSMIGPPGSRFSLRNAILIENSPFSLNPSFNTKTFNLRSDWPEKYLTKSETVINQQNTVINHKKTYKSNGDSFFCQELNKWIWENMTLWPICPQGRVRLHHDKWQIVHWSKNSRHLLVQSSINDQSWKVSMSSGQSGGKCYLDCPRNFSYVQRKIKKCKW